MRKSEEDAISGHMTLSCIMERTQDPPLSPHTLSYLGFDSDFMGSSIKGAVLSFHTECIWRGLFQASILMNIVFL